jgi:hypothetical protein
MILYVNGCSHTAGAEGVDTGSRWCDHVAYDLDLTMACEAQIASSNARIMRTTREWLRNRKDGQVFVILQWSTWEREEWWYHDRWYQVNASGVNQMPTALHERYRDYVINVDWQQKTQQAHQDIWSFHEWLQEIRIPHLFYNSWSTFSDIEPDQRHDWGEYYLDPYSRDGSYAAYLQQNGFDHTDFYHFGQDAHRFWAKNIVNYLQHNQLI